MAAGRWSAPGNEHAVALASAVAYCSRLRTARAGCKTAGAPLSAYSGELPE